MNYTNPWRWVLAALGTFVGIYLLVIACTAVTLPFRTAHGVTKRVTNPNNVIFQYEKFHDACSSVRALDQQYAEAQKAARWGRTGTSSGSPTTTGCG